MDPSCPAGPVAVRTRDLAERGVPSHALAREVADGRRRRLLRGVVTAGASADTAAGRALERASAAALLVPDAVVSHAAAAAVLALAVAVAGTVDQVCVTRSIRCGNGRRPDGRRVHVHTAALDDDSVRWVVGIALTSPARTLCDIARAAQLPDALVTAGRGARAGRRHP